MNLRNNLPEGRVLLVEDDMGDQHLVRRALCNGAVHADLQVIGNGDEALDYLSKWHGGANGNLGDPLPDLILLDLNLPGASGWTILAATRNSPATQALPIVVFSTSAAEDDVRTSYELGCSAYIVKPESARRFIDTMRSVYQYWMNETAASGGEEGGPCTTP